MIDRTQTALRITAGVDTHKDTRTAAALDANGRAIGNATFPTSAAGYAQLLDWLRSSGSSIGSVSRARASYGSGLAHHLREQGVTIV